MYILWDLFVAFFRANIVAYGGGVGAISFIQKEVVDIYGWMSQEEFANTIVVGNALPGPIATKLAMYIGYNVAGVTGAIISLLATVIPTAFMMMALIGIITKYKDAKIIKGIMLTVQPVVVMLLLQVIYNISKSSINSMSLYLGLITLASFLGVFYFDIHPVLLIVLAIFLGAIFSEIII